MNTTTRSSQTCRRLTLLTFSHPCSSCPQARLLKLTHTPCTHKYVHLSVETVRTRMPVTETRLRAHRMRISNAPTHFTHTHSLTAHEACSLSSVCSVFAPFLPWRSLPGLGLAQRESKGESEPRRRSSRASA